MNQREEAQKVYRNLKNDPWQIAEYLVQRCGDFFTDTERKALIAEFLHVGLSLPPQEQAPATTPEFQEENVLSINVFREDDGRFAAEYRRDGDREGGMGSYSATPIGALAELIATLIKVDEDKAKERVSVSPPAPETPQRLTLVLNGQPIALDASQDDQLVALLPRAFEAAGIADCFQQDTRWHFARRDGTEVDHEMTVRDFGDDLLFVHLGVGGCAAPPAPETWQPIEHLIAIYEQAKEYWSGQCYDFTSAPESLRRAAHEQAREGFDAICKALIPFVMPTLKAEFDEASKRPSLQAAPPSEPTK